MRFQSGLLWTVSEDNFTHLFYFIWTGKGPEGPRFYIKKAEDIVLPTGLQKKRNYNLVLNFYREHPRTEHRKEIQSLHLVAVAQPPDIVVPVAVGDDTTWRSMNHHGSVGTEEDLPAKEEEAPVTQTSEQGEAILLAKDSDDTCQTYL